MQENKLSEKGQRLLDGINAAYKKMLERKARLGQKVVTADEHGVVRAQPAIDVYTRVYGPLPPL